MANRFSFHVTYRSTKTPCLLIVSLNTHLTQFQISVVVRLTVTRVTTDSIWSSWRCVLPFWHVTSSFTLWGRYHAVNLDVTFIVKGMLYRINRKRSPLCPSWFLSYPVFSFRNICFEKKQCWVHGPFLRSHACLSMVSYYTDAVKFSVFPLLRVSKRCRSIFGFINLFGRLNLNIKAGLA